MVSIVKIVRVESGILEGVANADGTVHAFQGIPYAAPPVGKLRWRPPQPVPAWSGTRKADRFGPRCVQHARAAGSIHNFGPEPESEDCLYLNVWTGAPAPDARLPVLVWIHGGAFYQGSGALPVFNGGNLARRGAVIVTVNYRLGRLGFLAHPELTRESPPATSGNYGWLDQIAALRWVQRNIAAFGGDPDCVTLMGQSVGSGCVSAFMASPYCKGLFQRAIGQSGASLGVGGRAGGTSMAFLDAAEQAGLKFMHALGAGSIDDLRQRSADEIQLSRPEIGWKVVRVLDPSQIGVEGRELAWPIIDGQILSETPRDLFLHGAQNDVPLITGANEDEDSLMFPLADSLEAFIARAHREYGDHADDFLRLYAARDDDEARRMGRAARGDETFVSQNWIWAGMQARTGRGKAYHYRFRRVPNMPDRARLGAFHGAEIPYVFRNFQVRSWGWDDWDRQLSDLMSSYWLNFARTGDPNGAGLPSWTAFHPENDATMIFGDRAAVAPVPERARLAFWRAHCLRDLPSAKRAEVLSAPAPS